MRPSISEKDEFLLNCLLDGDLTEQQAALLRERIQKEPALGEVYQSYVRINASLEGRKQDHPTVDWANYHNSIMQPIMALPGHHRVIRIGKWLLLGGPLAAAAAVVLLFTFYEVPTGKVVNPQDLNKTRVVSTPDDTQSDKMVVHYNRPVPGKNNTADTIKVNYGRSTELTEATQKGDEAIHQTGPSWQWFGAVKTNSPMPAGELLEIPPL